MGTAYQSSGYGRCAKLLRKETEMEKLWAGALHQPLDQIAEEFNSSITVDCKLWEQDILGSIAHANMLGKQGIIPQDEAAALAEELKKIQKELKTGKLSIDWKSEDIHTFVEQTLTQRLGEVGKKLHTARSRNDQVALDLRLYLRQEIQTLQSDLKEMTEKFLEQAQKHKGTIMPGYTHLQRAQPITFGHHLMAYTMMFLRDIGRFQDAQERMNVSPIGSCALAGTTYPIDRQWEAESLGFSEIAHNSLDGVSDRDFCVELLSACSILMMHMSRFSEELILWSSWEFQFVTLADPYTTGSSIMPQKKNPDMAELIRGKTGRVYGDLIGTLTMLKGLPLAYNKDMQEDKEAVFDALQTVKLCVQILSAMVETLTVKADNMLKAAQTGFLNATDLADYLVKKGLPFRKAYQIVGAIVAYCLENNCTLESLSMETYQQFSPLFAKDVYTEIALATCVAKRCSQGGTSEASVEAQIAYVKQQLKIL